MKRFRTLSYVSLGLLAVIAVVERLRGMRARKHRWSQGRAAPLFAAAGRVKRGFYVPVLLAIGMAGLIQYQRELTATVGRLETEITKLKPKGVGQPPDGVAPIPVRPSHPHSLNVTYYRGNDERSGNLFNGGFYCTAKFELSLVDGQRQPVRLGDAVAGRELLIRLQIERAPGATKRLFTEAIMNSVLLSSALRNVPTPGLESEVARLEVLDPGERWVAHYPLDAPSATGEEQLTGSLFVYKGAMRDEKILATYHYGISYDLHFSGGQIVSPSDLWMGSLFRLGNQVDPGPGILLSEWYDFRPIPEITGKNSKDPKLLGIEEHFGPAEPGKTESPASGS